MNSCATRPTLTAIVSLVVLITATACADVVYVNLDAAPGGDGSSWTSAMHLLQDALDHAALVSQVDEVWIAGGEYRPSVERLAGISQSSSFVIHSTLVVRGGFSGTEVHPDERAPGVETVLSGDLLSDDGARFANRADNAWQVVVATSSVGSIVLDRLTIRGGSAIGTPIPLHDQGGAVEIQGLTHLDVRDCRFIDNQAVLGGAIVTNASCDLSHSVFAGNRAVGTGFVAGGAVHFGAVSLGVNATNCLFVNNHSEFGGAVSTFYAGITAINCTFVGNTASATAGAIMAQGPLAFVTIVNSILWNNPDANGSDDTSQIWTPDVPFARDVRHSCIEGLTIAYSGPGAIAGDPLFVDLLGPDGIAGSGDEDLRLATGSPCIDSGENGALAIGVTTDLANAARYIDDPVAPDVGAGSSPLIDMGVYERQLCVADWDKDGSLNTGDFLAYLNDFNLVRSGDVAVHGDPDLAPPLGTLNTADFLAFLGRFATGCDEG